jgi:hypothetical protein
MPNDPERAAREPSTDERSWEDSDAAWGDSPDSNDDRLHEDRPPHWGSD